LPPDYKEIYSVSKVKKNVKFVSLLRGLGMHETASKVENDKSILIEADFSPLKSRIEYSNRIVGVIISLMISLRPTVFIAALITGRCSIYRLVREYCGKYKPDTWYLFQTCG
jgi:hypothetical protein